MSFNRRPGQLTSFVLSFPLNLVGLPAMKKRFSILGIVAFVLISSIALQSCKGSNKKDDAQVTQTDSTHAFVAPPSVLGGPNLPHGDSTLVPILSKVLDEVLDASKNKDYTKLASYLVYRGPDTKRFGYDVFNAKNAYDRNVVRITGEVFNKWNKDVESKDYARIFSMQQPDGRAMNVMEVIFVSKKGVNRKFFGFIDFGQGNYKIVDVTSDLGI
jgi:hypothetical protein